MRLDLYDIHLNSYQTEGGTLCEICGDVLLPDEDVVLTDDGEVHSAHVLGRPEECLRVEDDRVLIADTTVGYLLRFVVDGDSPRFVAHGLLTGVSSHTTEHEAARAAFHHTYPEGE